MQTIYIDPPFNKEQDADYFYSVKCKDSAWAILLENRLRLARDLLNERGSIFVLIKDKKIPLKIVDFTIKSFLCQILASEYLNIIEKMLYVKIVLDKEEKICKVVRVENHSQNKVVLEII